MAKDNGYLIQGGRQLRTSLVASESPHQIEPQIGEPVASPGEPLPARYAQGRGPARNCAPKDGYPIAHSRHSTQRWCWRVTI